MVTMQGYQCRLIGIFGKWEKMRKWNGFVDQRNGNMLYGNILHGYIGYTDMVTLICNSKSVLGHFGSMFWIVFQYLDNISLREFFYLE